MTEEEKSKALEKLKELIYIKALEYKLTHTELMNLLHGMSDSISYEREIF